MSLKSTCWCITSRKAFPALSSSAPLNVLFNILEYLAELPLYSSNNLSKTCTTGLSSGLITVGLKEAPIRLLSNIALPVLLPPSPLVATPNVLTADGPIVANIAALAGSLAMNIFCNIPKLTGSVIIIAFMSLTSLEKFFSAVLRLLDC